MPCHSSQTFFQEFLGIVHVLLRIGKVSESDFISGMMSMDPFLTAVGSIVSV